MNKSSAQPVRPALPGATIKRVETFVFRAKLERPVVTSFAAMEARVAILVRVEDGDGAHGWGEIWCNFPAFGAEHRAQILHRIIVPRVLGKTVRDPAALWFALARDTHALAVQSGEPGPIAAALAGLDGALWDLLARKAGLPLCQVLGAAVRPVGVYASGLNPGDGPQVALRMRAHGFRAYKQKIGFGEAIDLANLRAIRAGMEAHELLMADVNQGWSAAETARLAPALGELDLAWIEEPILADRPVEEWRACARACSAPLAGGENLRAGAIEQAIDGDWLGVIQPDLGKWGGISASLAAGQRARAAGKLYCPHWLAGGVGLLASAHVLIAVGGAGLLEVDANDNPLREALAQPYPQLRAGEFHLAAGAGLGVEPDLATARAWLRAHQTS